MAKTTDPRPDKAADGKLQRRGFLKALGLGAGAAAVGVDASLSPAAAQENRSDRLKARYRESDHVKAYYRTNRY